MAAGPAHSRLARSLALGGVWQTAQEDRGPRGQVPAAAPQVPPSHREPRASAPPLSRSEMHGVQPEGRKVFHRPAPQTRGASASTGEHRPVGLLGNPRTYPQISGCAAAHEGHAHQSIPSPGGRPLPPRSKEVARGTDSSSTNQKRPRRLQRHARSGGSRPAAVHHGPVGAQGGSPLWGGCGGRVPTQCRSVRWELRAIPSSAGTARLRDVKTCRNYAP